MRTGYYLFPVLEVIPYSRVKLVLRDLVKPLVA